MPAIWLLMARRIQSRKLTIWTNDMLVSALRTFLVAAVRAAYPAGPNLYGSQNGRAAMRLRWCLTK